jgi:hypothetical protein
MFLTGYGLVKRNKENILKKVNASMPKEIIKVEQNTNCFTILQSSEIYFILNVKYSN